MPTPIEDYRNAAIEHNAAAERAKQIVERVHKGAEILQQWQSVIVTNIPGPAFPEKIGLARKATEFDGVNWPTGEQIAEALSAYHATRQRVFDRYDAIPKPEQFVVQGPHRICGHDPWQFDHKGRGREAHGMRVAVRQLAQRARQLIPMRHPRVVKQALVVGVPARVFSQSKRLLNFSREIWRGAVAGMSNIFGRIAAIGALVVGVPARILSQSKRLLNFSKEIWRGAVAGTSKISGRVAAIGALVVGVAARILSRSKRLLNFSKGIWRGAVAGTSKISGRVAAIGALVVGVPARILSQSKRLLNFSKEIWRAAVARMSAIFGRVAAIGALVVEVPARIFSRSKRLLNFPKGIWRGAVAGTTKIIGRVAAIGALLFFKGPARIFSKSQRLVRIGNGRARRSHSSQPSQIARQSVESRVQPVVRERLAPSAQSLDFDLVDAAFEKQQENESPWAVFWMIIFVSFFVFAVYGAIK
jgi:hypothetical protein